MRVSSPARHRQAWRGSATSRPRATAACESWWTRPGRRPSPATWTISASGPCCSKRCAIPAIRDCARTARRLLSRRAQSADIRGALVYLVGHDQNDGVRLKAMEGLKSFATDPEVRARTITGAAERHQSGRAEASHRHADSRDRTILPSPNIDRAMIGTLQELMLRESNASVRQRGQRVLEAINASAEIY